MTRTSFDARIVLSGATALLLGGCSAPRPSDDPVAPETRTDEVTALDPEAAAPRVSVLTHHIDNARSGANLAETVLTPARIKQGFGKLMELSIDDQTYAQPLLVTDVAIAGKGTHDVLYAATVNNTLYAFDAIHGGAPLWTRSLNGSGRPVANTDVDASCKTFSGSEKVGIVGTPVIDGATKTLYVVARTLDGGKFVQRLHAIDITSGADRSGSPIVITASVAGTGDGNDGHGHVPFDPKMQQQRPALLLSNNTVTIAWSSHCDKRPYHGWVMSYDATTLAQTGAWNDTPNGGQAGIWQAGGGPVADTDGTVYVGTGNGTWDGTHDFGESMVKLAPRTLALRDWFTPAAYASMNQSDSDFASAGTILVPGTDRVVTGTKTGRLFVMTKGSLGHMVSGDTQIPQSFVADLTTSGTNHVHGGPVFWKSASASWLYVWPENDYLRAFPMVNGAFDTPGSSHSPEKPSAGMPGGILAVSANGTTNGVVWATHPTNGDAVHATRHGALRAYDASDLSKELWNSVGTSADDLGSFAKFVPPTVANGRVYVATFSNKIVVYGPK